MTFAKDVASGCFAFVEVDDDLHDVYNWWHSSDHMPENLALRDVASGVRWAAPRSYIGARLAAGNGLEEHQYVVQYLMEEPLDRAFRDFAALGDELRASRFFSSQRIIYCGHHHHLMTRVASGEPVSEAALPFRPHSGVFIVITDSPVDSVANAAVTDALQKHVAAMLDVDSVVGASCYQLDIQLRRDGASTVAIDTTTTARHVFVYYLDDDPLVVTSAIASRLPGWAAGRALPNGPDAMSLVLAGPYETIADPRTYRWGRRP